MESVMISNSIISKLDFFGYTFENEVIIENCIIDEFIIHSCWFKKGLTFKGNHVLKYIDYQMGGHNQYPIHFISNIFHDFFNFFDCQFEKELELRDNIFLKGTNLLGNTDEGYKNTFEILPKLIGNIGALDLSV